MNIQQAIIKLKEANGVVYSEYMGIENDKFVDEVNEAVNIAIRSLEAWDKVIKEIIKTTIEGQFYEYPNRDYEYGAVTGSRKRQDEIIEIIKKYLCEVDDDSED